MYMCNRSETGSLLVTLLVFSVLGTGNATEPLTQAQKTSIEEVVQRSMLLEKINSQIWELAEVGLNETKSAKILVEQLIKEGFTVKQDVAGMPTAFVASYGEGKPVIGILAEYDALPGMSQERSAFKKPINSGQPGHACGHSGLGTGSLGAVLAIKVAMEKHNLKGTIRLYGTPAEETVIGKVYMLLAGEFKDLDVCLHWHPSTKTRALAGSSKALVSVKYTFRGTAAHASGSPENGRSALDAVELMNVGGNYMREHIKDDSRLHYVITDGGGAPNVVPAQASVWYYIRADDHHDVEKLYSWVNDIAQGAALMTRTQLSSKIDTDCHEVIPNIPLAQLLEANLHAVGAPEFSDADRKFARGLQAPLIEQFNTEFPMAIEESIQPYQESMSEPTRGSTDVGDISWYVPTGGLATTCFASKSPGHSWQNVAAIGSSIGVTGIIYAAKVLASTTIHLLENPDSVQNASEDWKLHMKNREYTTLIPKGQGAPKRIR
ncbi:MAG: amidohydrolase [Planctomycetes bacterium]|nr:amidohydrolase [Planctomycetota bacterium]